MVGGLVCAFEMQILSLPALGEKARDVFVKSKLPVEKLSQIWYTSLLWLLY